jgi:hypothetical protein
MCLKVDEYYTEIYKNKPKDKPIRVWKVVEVAEGILHSPYRGSEILIDPETLEFSTKSSLGGRVVSNKGWFGFPASRVEDGIHAFLTRQGARDNKPHGCPIVRAYVYPEDIIGVGSRDIAATRIFFHPEDVE